MDKLLRGLTTFERTTQIIAVVGVALFLGYLGLTSYSGDRTPTTPLNSPTIRQ